MKRIDLTIFYFQKFQQLRLILYLQRKNDYLLQGNLLFGNLDLLKSINIRFYFFCTSQIFYLNHFDLNYWILLMQCFYQKNWNPIQDMSKDYLIQCDFFLRLLVLTAY